MKGDTNVIATSTLQSMLLDDETNFNEVSIMSSLVNIILTLIFKWEKVNCCIEVDSAGGLEAEETSVDTSCR